ncbi:hypothetical protein LY76DRAFT_646843 [Colletotrichum caudatum]|nr:hypothetical protein LY76DRAFT_646843 [Colletotrichum caudatum]
MEMVDQIYDREGEDVPLEVAMITALGLVNGTKVTNDITRNNPSWTRETTRFEIWSDMAAAALERGVFVSPDVHVSKASWCCSHTDGNAWFGDVPAGGLAGSYRVRSGAQGLPDTWGLTNHERNGWNHPATVEGVWKPWVKAMNPTRKS